MGVRADVADAAAGARAGRVGAPFGLLVAAVLELGGEPVLRVLDLHDAQLAKFAGRDHRTCLTHHGIAGVVMCQSEDEAGAVYGCDEIECIVQRRRHRFVADDVDAGFQKGARRRMMDVVGRHDRNRIDAVIATAFRPRHVFVGGVGAVRRDADLTGRRMGAFRIRGQRAGDQFIAVIHARRKTVHGADKRALPTANHP